MSIDRANLVKLRDRITAATGPDRGLDVAIAQTIWPQLTMYQTYCVGDEEPLFFADPFYKRPCPHFTTSLDAAVTLVPAGMDWQAGWSSKHSGLAGLYLPDAKRAEARGKAATPALALCLARIEHAIANLEAA